MPQLNPNEKQITQTTQSRFRDTLTENGISLCLRSDFNEYVGIRHRHGDTHLNQVFDPRHVKFSAGDFWLLAENARGEAIATYCLRRFLVEDFFDLIETQALWFSTRSRLIDRRFVVECEIPPFGGEVVHGGGLWIRGDYRGASRLAVVLPRFARAVALYDRSFDHDSAMIRNNPEDPAETVERKATYMGRKVYGYARVHRFVDGWFPPERRKAIMHLCHSTKTEAIASLFSACAAGESLRPGSELRQLPLIDQHDQSVYPPTVLSQGQQQARI